MKTIDTAILLQAAQTWTSQSAHAWTPNLSTTIFHQLESDITHINDLEWGAYLRDIVQSPIDDPLKWTNRYISLSDNNWALTHIRFRNRDFNKPFVEVLATSLAPEISQLAQLTSILDEYREFNPLCMRIFFPDYTSTTHSSSKVQNYPGKITVDQFVTAETLAKLRKYPKLPGYEKISLEPIDIVSACEEVNRIYQEIAAKTPASIYWAHPGTMEELSPCVEDGLVLSINLNHAQNKAQSEKSEQIGILACRSEHDFGLTGYLMYEICIDPRYHGHGYGARALQHLAQLLPDQPGNNVLWGHVNPENFGSYKNILASGRQVIGARLWLSPTGYPGMILT